MPEGYPQTPDVPEEPRDLEEWQRLAEAANEWPNNHVGLRLLRDEHVKRLLTDRGLGHLVDHPPSKEEKAGARFLHQHGSLDKKEVDHVVSYLRQGGAVIPDKAGDRTAAYLGFMADTVKDGILTGEPDSVDRQIEAHVIKPEDVPESHFELQRRIAREQGHGDIEITEDLREQLINAVQADQKASLENWVEYLGGNDGSYPDWFKRYTWNAVTKLGAYDKEKAKFDKRDQSTVAVYPELNREALANVYDTVKKFHVLGEQVEEPQLQQIIKEGSFGRLYAHAINEVVISNPELYNTIEGSWTRFRKTNDPRVARRLSGSIRGYGTGWCTAGESTAESQLSCGDFYVYYTRDEDGKDTIPRVAIRMEEGLVAEVRGILPGQELEPELLDTANEILDELPGGESYIEKVEDMKRVTRLEQMIHDNPDVELSPEDVRFLYQLDRLIMGFGYRPDPRIDELISRRNSAADLNPLFQNNPNWEGDLFLPNITEAKGLILPESVGGELYLYHLTSARGLTLPRSVGGMLDLRSLTSADSLTLPESVGDGLNLHGLTSAKDLTLPRSVGRYIDLGGLTSADGLTLPESAGRTTIDLRSLASAKGLTLPESIGGDLDLHRLTSAKDLTLPRSVGGGLNLRSLTSAKDLTLPELVGGYLDLRSLASAKDLTLPRSVGGWLDLRRLNPDEALTLPELVGGELFLGEDSLSMEHRYYH